MQFRLEWVTVLAAGLLFGLVALSLSCEESQLTAGEGTEIFVTASPTTVSIDEPGGETAEQVVITALLVEEGGFPASGLAVLFTATSGSFASDSVVTDANGSARNTLTFDLNSEGGVPEGEVEVTARSGAISGSVTVTVDIVGQNQLPTAAISASPSGCPATNQDVNFSGTTTDPDTPDDPITCWCWTIDTTLVGADEVVAGASLSDLRRSFTSDQNLTVRLRVSDVPGVTCATDCENNPGSQFGPFSTALSYRIDRSNPIADAGPDQTATIGGGANAPVVLNGNQSSDPHSGITTYQWLCGNGTNQTGVSVTCSYTTAGTYTAQLTVTNACALTDSDTAQVTVNP